MPVQALPQAHERRSWHYPPPWEGVAWMPARTPLRDSLSLARLGLVGFIQIVGLGFAVTSIGTALITVAFLLGSA